MVTVSSVINNQFKTPVNSGSFPGFADTKSYIDQNFRAKNTPQKKKEEKVYKEDTILDNTLSRRIKNNIEKTLDIPLVNFPRGLGGAPDYTFFEFLQTAKFPYYVGGPVLAALFYAGVKKDNFKSAKAAQMAAKKIALGVGLYYVGAALAKSIITHTVKAARGMDLRHPYVKAVSTSTNQTGVFKKGEEYRSVYESADFTRTDLLYNKDGKTPEEINAKYIELGKKFGVKTDDPDIDQTIKPLIKKTIIMARAWQYALTAFFVTLGIGMANQPAWTKTSQEGFKKTVSQGIFGKNLEIKDRLHNAKIAVYDYMIKPFGKSFKEFWTGHSKASSIAGKSVILATAAATITAISLILSKTSAKKHDINTDQEPKMKETRK